LIWLPVFVTGFDGDVMTSFRALSNPFTGEHIVFTETADTTDGEFVRFDWRSSPGGNISEHVHPRQEERFTILSGAARFTVNGKPLVAEAGQTVVVPAGTPHSEGNFGTVDVLGTVVLRPALHAKQWHEALAGLAADFKCTARGAPTNPLQLGATFWHFRHDSRPTSPPIWVQDLVLPPLWLLAKIVGKQPYYEHWDSRIDS
jgi:mannose-6-phosphate isomerase-like protein (cupin superfamily)